MSWVKIDDQFTDHPKIVQVGPLAAWLYVCSLTYASRYLTDGFIPQAQVRRLADVSNATSLAEKLVDVGLWDRVDGGFTVHDYLEYNPTAEKVKAERDAAKERMKNKRSSDEVQANISRSSPSPTRTPTPISESITVVKQEQVDSSLNSTLAHSEPPEPKQDTEFDEFFQQFWQDYPKNRDGIKPKKAETLKRAKKIHIRDRPLVLQAVRNYPLYQKVIDGYVKEPSGFLNNDYWRDYLEPPDTTAIERSNSNGRANGNSAGWDRRPAKAIAAEDSFDEEVGYRTGRPPRGNDYEIKVIG